MSIGFADKGSSQEKKLALGQAANALHIDISFNEPVYDWQEVEIRSGSGVGDPEEEEAAVILAYSVHELMAEKLRAIVQQKIRNRYRRQDIYDIARILSQRSLTADEVAKVFSIFLEKCRNRDIAPTRGMMDDRELYERSREKYAEMKFDQMSVSLDFEADFAMIVGLYQSMPWSD